MKTLIAISMTVLALGLVACGDDNDDNASSQEATNAQTTTTPTTTSKDNGKSKTTADSKTKKKKRSSSSDDNSSSSKPSSSKPRTTNSGKGSLKVPSVNPNSNANRRKEPVHTEKEAEDLSSQLIAKRVCQGFLPKQTEREIEKNKTTFEEIARNYAKGWPKAKQDVAYKGCLQGLRARKVDKK
jgi:DNA polymerase III gamma/tau subunit